MDVGHSIRDFMLAHTLHPDFEDILNRKAFLAFPLIKKG